MENKLLIEFSDGVYSQNKIEIKKVFTILNYKYAGSEQINENEMICLWKRKEDNKIIKGIFHGSGKKAEFIIDYVDAERRVFESISKTYNAKLSQYQQPKDLESLLILKAKAQIDKWWTPQLQYKNEPLLFYQRRKEKEKESYNNWIKRIVEQMKQNAPH